MSASSGKDRPAGRIRAARWVVALCLFAAPVFAADGRPGRIALIGTDHQVYLQNPNGGEAKALTRGEDAGRMTGETGLRFVQSGGEGGRMRFSHPTWSPDGTRLLVHGTRISGEIGTTSGVYRLDPQRPGVVTPLFEDPRRGPIYVFWDPTGARAAVLLDDREGVTLGIVGAEDGGWTDLGSALPFYFAWREDGGEILAHTGGSARENPEAQVRRTVIGGEPKWRTVSNRPAGFRAPSWGPKRRFVYAAWPESDGGPSLRVHGADGSDRTLGRVSSHAAFSWSPDGKVLAVAESAVPSGGLYAGLSLVGASDGKREAVYAGPLAGFFWSPDGRKILVFAPDFDTGEWRALVVARAGGVEEALRFLPSPETQMLMLHFDQYALSHRLWAPDSRHFVFAAYPADAGREGPAEPTVWVVDTDTGSAEPVAEGRSAFWSPR